MARQKLDPWIDIFVRNNTLLVDGWSYTDDRSQFIVTTTDGQVIYVDTPYGSDEYDPQISVIGGVAETISYHLSMNFAEARHKLEERDD